MNMTIYNLRRMIVGAVRPTHSRFQFDVTNTKIGFRPFEHHGENRKFGRPIVCSDSLLCYLAFSVTSSVCMQLWLLSNHLLFIANIYSTYLAYFAIFRCTNSSYTLVLTSQRLLPQVQFKAKNIVVYKHNKQTAWL